MNKEILQNTLDLQNKFILELFNDERIPNEVKIEYLSKYNKLQIKTFETPIDKMFKTTIGNIGY